MKVLIIDGPARGQVFYTEGIRFIAVGGIPIGNVVGKAQEEMYSQTVYHVHKYVVAGRMLRLASVSALSEGISDDDVFDLIISDKAKETVNEPG